MSIASLGPIMQLAFVPEDIEAAIAHWLSLGAGPFFRLRHIAYKRATHRGAETNIDFSMAVGYWGDMQIELIDQHNDAPSIYRDWLDAGRTGLHHVCIEVDDIAAARREAQAANAEILQDIVLEGVEAIYVDPGQGAPLIELIEGAGLKPVFAMMRDAARDWDGSDPVRELG
ncbi:VOC family protein [Sphingomonas profundi]|uniref:VOC family protein n=1 Tax=Alterirhizorhabdus profundi TaxID=2681549 RepID=UPI0018D14461|nr:VOC family protein [Sphingomonas profundi]